MAPSYKLTYFNAQALGEPIRWFLSLNDIEFEDVRKMREEWFGKLKATDFAPFGQMPVLEIDGEKFTQSSCICRYLGKKAGLGGKTDLDALKADIIVDTISDFRVPLASHFYDDDPVSKAKKLGPLQKETVPFYLSRFDKIVKENNGFFVNGQMSWADVYFVSISEYLGRMAGDIDLYKGYPNLSQLRDKVMAIPQIKAWVAKRGTYAY